VARVEHLINAAPEQIFAVLADGWTYSDWVVGTAHIRDVDPDWPAPGTQLHHKAGPWPFSVRDTTVSLDCHPPHLLLVAPKLWPLGAARVTFELVALGPTTTRVAMTEEFAEGPLHLVRTVLENVALRWRNKESLRRLGDLATRRVPKLSERRG
jgi:Polyketide cyclase / dehydrase and lipid transport